MTVAVDSSVRRRRAARITKTMTIKGPFRTGGLTEEDTFFPRVT
jgi:hypothetical protein